MHYNKNHDYYMIIIIDWKDRRMIRNLYIQQMATVRVAEGESELVEIGP